MSGAVKCNKLLGEPSVAEIEDTVKMWLRYASARDGGRYNKRSKTLPQTPEEQKFEPDGEL